MGASNLAEIKQTRLYTGLKRIDLLRRFVWKMREIRRELDWTVDAIRSGRFLAYRQQYATSSKIKHQQILSYDVDLPPLGAYQDLLDWLKLASLDFREGAFCIYLPPQAGLEKAFGAVLRNYPAKVGLKILKDLKPPSEAKYVSQALAPGVQWMDDWTSCDPIQFLRVANCLHSHGMGPRAYDLVELRSPQDRLSAYVVQHVGGQAPSEAECQAFMERLTRLFKDPLLPMPGWERMEDFRCPGCKGNLLKDSGTGQLLYIDFQSFMIRDSLQYLRKIADEARKEVHFGDKHLLRGGRYLYQSIPGLQIGQRMIDQRWSVINGLMAGAGASVAGKVVFDVGCNMGMMIYTALTEGARWAVGWDMTKVAAQARQLLLALGMTRFDIFGGEIDPLSDFRSQLPPQADNSAGSVLFYLAMHKHIGFPEGVNDLPFEYMVYEGHETDSVSDTEEHLREIQERWRLQVKDITTYQDGDSRERTVAVLKRA